MHTELEIHDVASVEVYEAEKYSMGGSVWRNIIVITGRDGSTHRLEVRGPSQESVTLKPFEDE